MPSAVYDAPISGSAQLITLNPALGGPRFDGIGVVNGGGATSVLLKDYPEPQRGQILDLVYRPKFGASVSALLVEIPGDGNATQGSMPSHMRTRGDLDHTRGYTWWIMREAKARNPALSLDAAAWSAPGWIGENPAERFTSDHANGDAAFWSSDAVEYLVKWLQGLRDVHGISLDAMGCRNEKGVSHEFAKALRRALDANGFAAVKLHGFDNWPADKLDFVRALATDPELRDALHAIGAHVLYAGPASTEVQKLAVSLGKPIWNTEDHVYLKGFDCALGIVECFNENFIVSGATRVVNWYDIAGVYPLEPYSEDPAAILAREPWNGHYHVREALWGYAHYGQFTAVGWTYLPGGCIKLADGGTVVALRSPEGDYSVVIETKDATGPQTLRIAVGPGLSPADLCVWRSDAREQFVRLPDLRAKDGVFAVTLAPGSLYSLSTTRGQQKGAFPDIPPPRPFPFPYREDFQGYADPARHGYLPRYTADIAGVFELVPSPDGQGRALRQAVPRPTISWAPDWRPYTIIGDAAWTDYEVSAGVWLKPGDTAAVMGRINHVGTGYGFIPKGYFAELSADGACRLVAICGKPDKKAMIGDAEQQRLIAASNDDSVGGEIELGVTHLPGVAPGRWHLLALRFVGTAIAVLVDGEPVLTATDKRHASGMAGLLAGQTPSRTSTPFFNNLAITAPDAA